ncbi:hypothetical protein GCM10027299_41660 [Larkinella ripae]
MKRNIILNKIDNVRAGFRLFYFKWLGLIVGKGTNLGRITCKWPNKVLIGNGCIIQDCVDFNISHPFDPDNKIKIGNNVFLGRCTEINSKSQITIHDNCWIASNTTIVDIFHETNPELPIYLQPIKSSAITIEEDVWIGSRSIILPGVRIGKGSVIGAGSVVNKHIPPMQIWAGVPAKYIKDR